MDPAIAKHAAGRAPRYTSYPTAPHFYADFPEATWRGWLAEAEDALLSLYLHVPFCRKVCWYCGCNMKLTVREAPVRAYAEALEREVALVAGALPGRRRAGRIHWGGGTPTTLPIDSLARVMARLRDRFDVGEDAEIAVEIDPRTLEDDMAPALGALGFTRASLGVQEFDRGVQQAINRVQPFESVARAVEALRAGGVGAIGFDLMYGLPGQTVETVTATVARAAALGPSRVALFGYAHVPWMAKNQRMIVEASLPDAASRFEQAEAAAALLVRAGYARIGLDHFARPSDPLAVAALRGRLRRNFQGYTDDAADALLGLGASAISRTPRGYVQNVAETGAWSRAVAAGRLPVARGRALAAEDGLRGEVIERLMCDLAVDPPAHAFAHGERPGFFARELAALRPFAEDGLVELLGGRVRVTERGRPALRAIASVFDAYLDQGDAERRHATAV